MSEFSLTPVGVIRSEAKTRKDLPPLGIPARIEIFPRYAEGLLRLEKHSHLWVLCWLDGAARDVLQVVPRGVDPTSADPMHGVFAVRSPSRPNPIGLTLSRIVRQEGPVIHVDRLDFIDGTPVIDLKPYFVARDLVFSARNEQIGSPADADALRESLRMQAVSYHGETCAEVELAVEICCHFRAVVLDFREPRDCQVRAPLSRPHLVDALIGMTRVSLGRGTLELTERQLVAFHALGLWHEYPLSGNGFQAPRR